MNEQILVLGGTREGRELAGALVAAGFTPMTSLAGRTTTAADRVPGTARVGGFGGVDGLADWLTNPATAPLAVVDASHPYAAVMSANAAAAAARTGVPLLALIRPGWAEHCDAPNWHWVADHDAAAHTAARLGQRPFLTIGRQNLPSYVGPLGSCAVLARVAELPRDDANQWPAPWTVRAERGPFDLAGELARFAQHDVDVLVTKDSGGPDTAAKLEAAKRVGVPVVVVRRPSPPPGVPVVHTVADAVSWCVTLRDGA